MNAFVVAALACLAVWGILLFGLAVPTGWIHALLAVGCVLLARGMIVTRRR
ncbi:MAG: hypothetical protein IH616_03315 [Gemmatimonadales bacterium]|jgi:hypothetical protein|nr:hypothetical protein [Gemmatimonadales bacterium]